MLAYTYISPVKFELIDKPKPELQNPRDAIVRITLGSICTSDLHIKHGSVPHAVPGITVGHEMVGVVEEVGAEVRQKCERGGADVVLEVAGAEDTFRLAWECARPNAIVTVVALYDKPQTLPLPDMYGKNLIFKTGGVDGCDCAEILRLIGAGKIDTTPLITHRYKLADIAEAYELFENKRDGVIKGAVTSSTI